MLTVLDSLTPPATPLSHVTVTREIPTDLDTPVSLYRKLAATTNGPSFLLESVTGGEQVARYSFIGVQPRLALVIRGRTIERHVDGRVAYRELPARVRTRFPAGYNSGRSRNRSRLSACQRV